MQFSIQSVTRQQLSLRYPCLAGKVTLAGLKKCRHTLVRDRRLWHICPALQSEMTRVNAWSRDVRSQLWLTLGHCRVFNEGCWSPSFALRCFFQLFKRKSWSSLATPYPVVISTPTSCRSSSTPWTEEPKFFETSGCWLLLVQILGHAMLAGATRSGCKELWGGMW